MLDSIRGDLVEIAPTQVVLECANLGYRIQISLHTYAKIKHLSNVFLYLYEHLREDSRELYGFSEKKERSIFLLLIRVSGVGANTARSILSYRNAEELVSIIANEQVQFLEAIKGIGKKTAERIVLELKDSVQKLAQVVAPEPLHAHQEDALQGLLALGIPRPMAISALEKAQVHPESTDVAELIKKALQYTR